MVMKRIFFFIVITLQGIVLLAQPKIAVYTPATNTTSIYSSFDAAYNAALSGDHIYLPGGSFSLASPVSKSIHIYGAGFNPDSSAVTGMTILDTIVIITGADNGSIEGVSFTQSYNATPSIHFDMSNSANVISNFAINSCNLSHGIKITPGSNGASCNYFTIRNNYIGSYNNGMSLLGSLINSMVSNNIIAADTQIGIANTFLNNIFYFGPYYSNAHSNYCTYQNNIFPPAIIGNHEIGYDTPTNSFFYNNMNASPSAGVGNSGTGNVDEDWLLTFDNSGNSYYQVKTTSLAHNSGTDGKDRGIYGWATPWKVGSMPSNPHISYKNVGTQNDPAGILHVTFKIKPQSY